MARSSCGTRSPFVFEQRCVLLVLRVASIASSVDSIAQRVNWRNIAISLKTLRPLAHLVVVMNIPAGEASNKFTCLMARFARSEVAVRNRPIISANVHPIQRDNARKSVLLDPCFRAFQRNSRSSRQRVYGLSDRSRRSARAAWTTWTAANSSNFGRKIDDDSPAVIPRK